MKSSYILKGVRKTLAFDEVCLSASIWRNGRQIGKFRDCPDSGKPIFEFSSESDQRSFETHILEWWRESDHQSLFDLQAQALSATFIAFEMPLSGKMRCWIKHMTGSVEDENPWMRQQRAVKKSMHL